MTVGAIIESIPNKPTADESDLSEEKLSDSDNEESELGNESIDGDLEVLSAEDKSSWEDNIKSRMKCVFALVDPDFNEDESKYDPKADNNNIVTNLMRLSITTKLLGL